MSVAQVRISSNLPKLAAKLKEAGDRGLNREVRAGLRLGTKPLIRTAKDAARAGLPHGGGLNEWVASSTFGVRTVLGGNPRVRIVINKKGHDLQDLDRGRIRHRVFGMDVWVDQQIAPEVITGAMARDADAVRAVLKGAIDDYLRRLT